VGAVAAIQDCGAARFDSAHLPCRPSGRLFLFAGYLQLNMQMIATGNNNVHICVKDERI
jgi:hypothetical protein